jgi:ATP-dependent DNA helicase RecG
MMAVDQWLTRIRLGEDSFLELKRLVVREDGKTIEPHADGLSDELAALANTKGGLVILGVDDKHAEVGGIDSGTSRSCRGMANGHLQRPHQATAGYSDTHVELPDAEGVLRPVIVVEVPHSLWVHQSANGYFRRVGHAKRELPPDALARLFQQRSQSADHPL